MTLEEVVIHLVARVAELQRRLDGMIQQGPVHEVDPKTGTVRLRLSPEGEDLFLSPPIPYAQMAGALKHHSSPSIGQQMTALNVGGDFRQGLAVPMTWSDANPSPSDKGDEHVTTFGQFRMEVRSDEWIVRVPKVRFECDGSSFELTGGGLKTNAPDYDFT